MFFLFVTSICILVAVDSVFKIVGRSSKELYFQVYTTAAGLIFFQINMLMAATGSAYFQLVSILAFVYISAILILFLIFLALVTSEVFYERSTYNQVVKIAELTITSMTISTTVISVFVALFYNFTEIAQITKAKIFLMDWLSQFDNRNVRYEDLRYKPIRRQSKVNYQIPPGTNTKQYFVPSKDCPHRAKVNAKINSNNIFHMLRAEVVDDYVIYTASAVLQGLCLILVIVLLI